jgi:hypothetical protein
MKWKIQSPVKFLRATRQHFFLKRFQPSPATLELLQSIYPGIDWRRVSFHEGLPWFTPFVAPYVTAQALPDFYSFRRFRIYLKKYDETRAQCIADIVHESFHIMQAMSLNKGYGIGFFRGFTWYYIAHFFKTGYRENPFEVPAYDQEFRFMKMCAKHHIHGISPPVKENQIEGLKSEAELRFSNFEFTYKGNKLHLLSSFLLCMLITLSKPPVDLLVFILSRLTKAEKTN